MNIDSFYTNGKLHGHKGEDYALHGEDYFIICDGCSSAKNSDVVARIQAHIAIKFLDSIRACEPNSYDFILKIIGLRVKNICDDLFIEGYPLATLIIGFIVKNNLRVIIVGDATIAYSTNNHTDIIDISYESNAPCYPYYYSSENILNGYKEKYKDSEKIVSYIYEKNNIDYSYKIDEIFFIGFNLDCLDYIYFFSDGISEFTGPNGKLPIKETIKAFTNMKNTNGVFIERRCKRQLKIYEKERIFPQDDFSMAGIYI